jgi:hypothetical protein
MKTNLIYILVITTITASCKKTDYYFKDIDEYEIGFLVKRGTSQLVNNEFLTEGRYRLNKKDDIIIYNLLEQRSSIELNCFTKDGNEIQISANVSFRILRDSVFSIHNKYGPSYKEIFIIPELREAVMLEIGEQLMKDIQVKIIEEKVWDRLGDLFFKQGISVTVIRVNKVKEYVIQ